MMRVNLTLPDQIVSMMEMFGDVSDVANRVLALAEEDLISVQNKPPVDDGLRYRKISVIVDNEFYENLLMVHGLTSRTISLKRLLCWFFDTEQYVTFGWTPCNDYVNKRAERFKRVLEKAEADIMTAVTHTPEYKEDIKELCDKIRELRKRL